MTTGVTEITVQEKTNPQKNQPTGCEEFPINPKADFMEQYTIDEKTNSVRPEFRLTFGHSLIDCTEVSLLMPMLIKLFSFRKPVHLTTWPAFEFPKDQSGRFAQFHDKNLSLCAIVPIESGLAVFGPDWWYLKLDCWMKMSSRASLNVAVVQRASASTTIAVCYSRGLSSGVAGMRPESINMPVMPSYRFRIGRDTIDIEGRECVAENVVLCKLLENDVVLSAGETELNFAYRYKPHPILNSDVQWFMSEAGAARTFWGGWGGWSGWRSLRR